LLLPNGDLVVDGRDKALVLDSNNFSYLLADFKKLGTNRETLSAGLLMGQKLVLGTLKGYVCVYKFNKDYKKDLSAKIQSSRIYCMTQVGENALLVGGHGTLEVISFTKNKLNMRQVKSEVFQKLYQGKDVLKIVKLRHPDHYAISVVEFGIKVVQIFRNAQKGFVVKVLEPLFMPDQTVSDLFEYEQDRLLAVSYYGCSYHTIDLLNNREERITTGFSDRGINIIPSPYFSEEFPYILAKESKWLCILHLKHKKIYKLTLCEDKCAGGQRMAFLPRNAQEIKEETEEKRRKGSEQGDDYIRKEREKNATFITTSCNVTQETSDHRARVRNGCIKKFKINKKVFVELSQRYLEQRQF